MVNASIIWKTRLSNYPRKNTTQLIGLGHAYGLPAGELKVGSHIIWNYGIICKVKKIARETAKSIWIVEVDEDSGKEYEPRRLLKSRIVARPTCEMEDEDFE